MNDIGPAISVVLLVGVVLAVCAFWWLSQRAIWEAQQAIWEALRADLRSSDPVRRRTTRIGLAVALALVAVVVAWIVIYDPVKFPTRR